MAEDPEERAPTDRTAGEHEPPAADERTREPETDTTTPAAGPGTPFTQQVGRGVMIVAAVLFGVFAVANVDSVTFNWIFGEGAVPLILLLVVSFGLGALVAWIATARHERRRRRSQDQASSARSRSST